MNGGIGMEKHKKTVEKEYVKPDSDVSNSAFSDGLWGKIPLQHGEPEITRRMKRECLGEFMFDIEAICTACYEAEAPQEDCEVCGGEITYNQKVAVPWDMVKDIYKRMAAVA